MSALTQWATPIITAVSTGSFLALLGLILVAAIMEIGLPVPFILDSSLLLVALNSGFISLPMLLLILALFVGRLIGSSSLYWLGRLFGGFVIKRIGKRWPKAAVRIANLSYSLNQPALPAAPGTRLTSRLLPALSSIFRVPMMIVIARFTPGLLTVSSIAAGGICENYGAFVLGIALSSIIADAMVLAVGFLASHGLRILGVTPPVWQLVIGLVILIYLGWGIFFLVRRRRRN